MVTVELIYDSDCPNVKEARAQLLRAFGKTNLSPRWVEWERSNRQSPLYVQGYGSPTILVDSQDVAGAPLDAETNCCRVYFEPNGRLERAPSAEAIAAALLKAGNKTPSDSNAPIKRHSWRSILASLPAIGTALLPKLACPACWPAYTGLLSALGLGFINYTPYLFPLTLSFLCITVGSLWLQARRNRRYLSLLLSIPASAVMLFGKFVAGSELAMYSGVALLVVASLLARWPHGVADPASCPACAPGEAEFSTERVAES
jgi:hypothetical protein